MYLVIALCVRPRQLLDFIVAERITHSLGENVLLNAWYRQSCGRDSMLDSTSISQYASSDCEDTIAAPGFVPRKSRGSDSRDNAVTEGVFTSLKSE